MWDGAAGRKDRAFRRRRAQRRRGCFDWLEPRLLLSGDESAWNAVTIPAVPADLLGGEVGFDPAAAGGTETTAASPIPRANHPLSDLPALSSKPGAAAKLYLDFDGDVTGTWGDKSPGTTPAFDQDGNPAQFSDSELTAINNIWARVAEAYSPFNLNVTTVDPGTLANNDTLKAVIGGSGAWASSDLIGGIGFVGGFYNSASNKVFVFSNNLSSGNVKFTAIAIGHETGHGFGLEHQSVYQGTTRVQEYNEGDINKGPFMGQAYDSMRATWWNGTSSSSTTIQDDLSVLSGPASGFGYRADDFGNTAATASPLAMAGNNASAAGIIERISDADVFSFSTGTGSVTLTANVAPGGPMLDLKLQLLDAAGNVLLTRDTASLGETITTSLTGGSYRLLIGSHGSYGDVGQYSITGTLQPAVSQVPGVPDLVLASDTGASGSDDLTLLDNSAAGKTLQFQVAGTLAGATVTLYADGTAIGSAVASGATTAITTNGTFDLSDGAHTLVARQTEVGLPPSAASGGLLVTIDTSIPAAPPAPDLQPQSDTGASNSDNQTSDLSPTFDVAAGPFFRVFRDGTLIGGDYEAGSTFTAATQSMGAYTFALRAVDTAGNVSPPGPGLAVQFVPGLSIADAAPAEGDAGSSNGAFTVTLSAASGQQVTVAYRSLDGTATANIDYTPVAGVLTFSPGATSRTLSVPILGDGLDEANETFTIELSAAENAILDRAGATGTIVDNDATSTLSVADVALVEGTGGVKNAVLSVALSQVSGLQVTVDYATAAATATASDFSARSGRLTFAPGVTSQSVSVPIATDADVEPDEVFHLNLSGAANAALADSQASVTIQNDDSITLTIADVSVVERDGGLINAVFPVTLSAAHYLPVKVAYATANGTAAGASDYAIRTGILTFAPGTTTQSIIVPTLGDVRDEPDETFVLNLSAPENVTLADNQAVGTIVDNDLPPLVAIDDVEVTETDGGTQNASFTVSLDNPSGFVITVQYTTRAGSAASPGDFLATSGMLTFAAGAAAKTVDVPIVGDRNAEPSETFTVELSNLVNVSLDDAIGLGTILDNDPFSAFVVNNTLDSGPGSLRAAVLAANAAAGPDVLVLEIPGAGPQVVQLASALPAMNDAVTVQVASGEVQIGAAAGFGFARFQSLTKTGGGTLVLGGTQSYDPGAALTISEGTLRLASPVDGNLTASVAARLEIAANSKLAALTVDASGAVALGSGASSLATASLAIASGGRLDLADAALVLQSTAASRQAALAAVRGWLVSGLNNFAWNGPGIASSAAQAQPQHLAAIGLLLNDNGAGGPLYSSFAGIALDANAILLKYTYYGDADLSGVISLGDFARTEQGFGGSLTGWNNGDFDYSGKVDGTDFALIDMAFNLQGAALGAHLPPAVVDGPQAATPRAYAAAIDAALADPAVAVAAAVVDAEDGELFASPLGGKRRR